MVFPVCKGTDRLVKEIDKLKIQYNETRAFVNTYKECNRRKSDKYKSQTDRNKHITKGSRLDDMAC